MKEFSGVTNESGGIPSGVEELVNFKIVGGKLGTKGNKPGFESGFILQDIERLDIGGSFGPKFVLELMFGFGRWSGMPGNAGATRYVGGRRRGVS